MRAVLIGLIQLYRWFLSPLLGQNCRYYPTCSCYAQDSLRRHGALRGSWLASVMPCAFAIATIWRRCGSA